MTTIELLKKTNACKNTLAAMPEAQKNQMLLLMAESLLENQADILAANARDMELAKDVLPPVMLCWTGSCSGKTASPPWPKAFGQWPHCLIRLERSSAKTSVPTACASARCGCLWDW